MPIIKISAKSFTDINLLKKRLKLNQMTHLADCDPNLFQFYLINVIEDHIPSISGNKIDNDVPSPYNKMNLLIELRCYEIFEYIGDSRIDGDPVFYYNKDTILTYLRNKRLNDLGI